jgi:hypothetical protein
VARRRGYFGGELDSIKGLCQRAVELLFGAWLVLLGVWGEQLQGTTNRVCQPSRPTDAKEL